MARYSLGRQAGRPPVPADWEVSVQELLSGHHLFTRVEAAAVGLAILDHLEREPAAPVSPENVMISNSGAVRLQAAADPGRAGDAAGDAADGVSATGRLLCDLLGVSPRAGGDLTLAERTAPGLVVTARTLARGRAGDGAGAAATMIMEAAGIAASPAAAEAARRSLGALVRRSQGPVAQAVSRVLTSTPAALPPSAPPPPAARRAFAARPGGPAFAPRPAAAPPRPAAAPVPSPIVPDPPRGGSRLPLAAIATVMGGVLLLALAAGMLVAQRGAGRAIASSSAARPASGVSPRPLALTGGPTTAPAPAFVPATSPDDAVRRFFTLVAQHQFDPAAQYWTPRLRDAVPPAQLVQQYGDVRSVDLRQDRVVAIDEDAGIANVLVDARVDVGGSTYDLVGNLYLATGPNGWRIDQIQVKQVTG